MKRPDGHKTCLTHWAGYLVAALFLVTLGACGGGGGGGGGDSDPSTTYPVWIVSPSDTGTYQTDQTLVRLTGGAFVPAGASCNAMIGTMPSGYEVTWTNAANSTSGAASYYLGCLLQANVIWRTLDIPLAMGANTITVTARDASGNTGHDTIVVTRLADGTPPTVLSVSPPDGSTGMGLLTKVTVTFSEAMDPASLNATSLLLGDASNNPIPSSVAAGPYANAWTLTPSAPLSYSTGYRITVTTGVRDLAGNPLAAPVTAMFTTTAAPDTQPPSVAAVSPAAGSGCAGATTPVEVTFSEYIDVNTLFFHLTGPGGLPVDGYVSHQEGLLSYALHPYAGLSPGVSYTATVAPGLKDYSGNATATPFSWTFSTSADGADHCK